MSHHVRIATRASQLALWQSEHVAALIERANPGVSTELVPITTQGDRIIDRALSAIGGKGLFIKELEVAMLEGRADIAVHSMKEVPAELPDGFGIEIVLAREDPRDTLISAGGSAVGGLAQGACVGTSSLRRRSQLLAVRPDLDVIDLRGNVPTRLQRFYDGQYDAIVLAAAGLIRLDKMIDQACPLPVQDMLPAVGQGAIGIECRQDDDQLLALLASLHHSPTATCVAGPDFSSGVQGPWEAV